jgi:hypothetical protein
LVLQSAFATGWGTGGGATITPNSATSPESQNTAARLDVVTTTFSSTSRTITTVSGTIYTVSVFAKKNTKDWIYFINLAGSAARVWFNVASGTVGTVGAGISNASIENYSNGWYRCSWTETAGGTTSYFQVGATDANNTATPTSSGSVFLWGAQFEASSSASPYVATTTAAVTNSIPRIDYYTSSGTAGCPGLLVEPSAQNVLLQSEAFNTSWTPVGLNAFGSGSVANSTGTTDPFGATNSDYIQENASSGIHVILQTPAGQVSGTTYTFSCFAKSAERTQINFLNNAGGGGNATFNLSAGTATLGVGVSALIQNYGNGWYRCILTYTPTATANFNVQVRLADASGNTSYTGTGTSGVYVFGAQLEVGSVATSYIPTTAAPVTRNADVVSISGAVSGCIGQSEGTIYAEVDIRNMAKETYIIRIDDGATSNIVSLRTLTGNVVRTAITAPTTSGTINISSAAFTAGIVKIAFAYKSGEIAVSVNGATALTTNGTFTFGASLSRVNLGSNVGGEFNDRIRAVALYTTRLPNEELELLTSPTYYSNVRDLIWGTFAARTSSFTELQSCLQTRHNQLIIV